LQQEKQNTSNINLLKSREISQLKRDNNILNDELNIANLKINSNVLQKSSEFIEIEKQFKNDIEEIKQINQNKNKIIYDIDKK
jgi:hypothetical protein